VVKGTGVARSPPPAPCCLRLGTQSGGGSWGSANLVRHPDSARVCVLMAAVALTDGVQGTAESWADLLSGCRRHGTAGGNRMLRLQWSPIRGLDGMPAAP